MVVESDVRGRMQPLKEQLTDAINQLHAIFETQVFVALCRGYWDRMGQVIRIPESSQPQSARLELFFFLFNVHYVVYFVL